MSIPLRSLKKQRAKEAPRVLVYGPPGMGKTSFCSEFPNVIFLQTEDGSPGDREIAKLPVDGRINSYKELLGYIGQLLKEDHSFTTVALDSLDKLEPLVWAAVCADNKWANIEEPGYGKGYAIVDGYWRYLIGGLEKLRLERGMTILYIAHSTIDRFESPTSAAYNRYDIRLHKRAVAIFQDEVDAIFFLNQDQTIKTDKGGFGRETTRAEGGGNIMIYAAPRPNFTAKNRYGIPAKTLFRPFKGYEAIGGYLPNQHAEVGDVEVEALQETEAPARGGANSANLPTEAFSGDPNWNAVEDGTTGADEAPADEPAQAQPAGPGGRRRLAA